MVGDAVRSLRLRDRTTVVTVENPSFTTLLAETQLNDPFALKLLKALFLVKYVKPFKATQRKWAIAGLIVVGLSLAFGCIAIVLSLAAAAARPPPFLSPARTIREDTVFLGRIRY